MMVVSNSFPMGARFKGDGGEVYVKRGNVLETKPVELKDQQPLPGEVRLYESPGHQADFLHCMRTRESTITPIEPAHRAISVAHLGNIAMRLEREVAWDPVAERFIGDAEADNMLLRAMRGPWHL
jgi:hypothetical protein